MKNSEGPGQITCQTIIDHLTPSLIIYLVTGLVHLVFVFISSIVLLVSASQGCDDTDTDYEDCVCDNKRYAAYSPILLSASIIFEVYNILGVWNANLVQVIVFILGAVFILLFSIFRCFFSTFETRTGLFYPFCSASHFIIDSYVLFGVSAVALIIYIICTIFSGDYYRWAQFQRAVTQQQQSFLFFSFRFYFKVPHRVANFSSHS